MYYTTIIISGDRADWGRGEALLRSRHHTSQHVEISSSQSISSWERHWWEWPGYRPLTAGEHGQSGSWHTQKSTAEKLQVCVTSYMYMCMQCTLIHIYQCITFVVHVWVRMSRSGQCLVPRLSMRLVRAVPKHVMSFTILLFLVVLYIVRIALRATWLIVCHCLATVSAWFSISSHPYLSILVSMAPLSQEVQLVSSCNPPHLGPAIAEMNSVWFKLWLYVKLGSGPTSLLLAKGTRLRTLPKFIRVSLLSCLWLETVCWITLIFKEWHSVNTSTPLQGGDIYSVHIYDDTRIILVQFYALYQLVFRPCFPSCNIFHLFLFLWPCTNVGRSLPVHFRGTHVFWWLPGATIQQVCLSPTSCSLSTMLSHTLQCSFRYTLYIWWWLSDMYMYTHTCMYLRSLLVS